MTLNLPSSRRIQFHGDDETGESSHDVNMSQEQGWYLQEWFAVGGLKQAHLVTQLGYGKNTAFRLWHGLQPFGRDNVLEISQLLNITPAELLMPPEEAMAIRRLRSALAALPVSDRPSQPLPDVAPVQRKAG